MTIITGNVTSLDQDNYAVIADSEGEFSITNDEGGTQGIDAEGNYVWTVPEKIAREPGQQPRLEIGADGRFERSATSALFALSNSGAERDANGDITLVSSGGSEIAFDGGRWTLDGEPVSPSDALLELGVTQGVLDDDGTFDIVHPDDSREFLTADGTYGFVDRRGSRIQIDAEGGGFIHESPDGNSVWRTADGEIGQTLGDYSGHLNAEGENRLGQYAVPFADRRDGFVAAFDNPAFPDGTDADNELDPEVIGRSFRTL